MIGARGFTQFALDLVERNFGHLEQHQAVRRNTQNLPAQLRTDRAAGAGDHDALAANGTIKQRRIRRHRVAPQQIAGVDFAQIIDARVAAK